MSVYVAHFIAGRRINYGDCEVTERIGFLMHKLRRPRSDKKNQIPSCTHGLFFKVHACEQNTGDMDGTAASAREESNKNHGSGPRQRRREATANATRGNPASHTCAMWGTPPHPSAPRQHATWSVPPGHNKGGSMPSSHKREESPYPNASRGSSRELCPYGTMEAISSPHKHSSGESDPLGHGNCQMAQQDESNGPGDSERCHFCKYDGDRATSVIHYANCAINA